MSQQKFVSGFGLEIRLRAMLHIRSDDFFVHLDFNMLITFFSRLSSRTTTFCFHSDEIFEKCLLMNADRLKPVGAASRDNLQVVLEAILCRYLHWPCSNYFSSLIS